MTTILKSNWTVTVIRDLASDYPFEVYTKDGIDDCFETYPEAIERAEELEAEAREERLDAIREAIAEKLADADEATLNAVKALLS